VRKLLGSQVFYFSAAFVLVGTLAYAKVASETGCPPRAVCDIPVAKHPALQPYVGLLLLAGAIATLLLVVLGILRKV
jgi:hypothetical protein